MKTDCKVSRFWKYELKTKEVRDKFISAIVDKGNTVINHYSRIGKIKDISFDPYNDSDEFFITNEKDIRFKISYGNDEIHCIEVREQFLQMDMLNGETGEISFVYEQTDIDINFLNAQNETEYNIAYDLKGE